jgi:phosphate transport system substrate-binding protein
VRAFVEFYLDQHKQIAEQALFIPLNAEQEAKAKAELAALTNTG